MQFSPQLLDSTDQTALASAIAAIGPLLAALNTAITSAETAGATVVSLQTQISTAKASFTGGALPLSFNALCDQLNTAEAAALPSYIPLHAATQACEPLVVQQLLPIAVHQAVGEIQTANAGLVPSGSAEANIAPLGSTFVTGLSAYFRSCFGPMENNFAAVLAKATRLQMLLTSVENGTDFYSL